MNGVVELDREEAPAVRPGWPPHNATPLDDLEATDGISYTETWHVLRTEKFFYNWEGEYVGLEPPDDGAGPGDDAPPSG